MAGRGLHFQVVFYPMILTAPNLCSGNSGVAIGYQVDKFTHTWLVECFIAQSHFYPGFMGKVSRLTHFPLGPGCEDYSFSDKVVEDFEHSLDSIIIDSVNTPELDASFHGADNMPSSVSLGFLHSDSILSDNSRLQLAPSTKSLKL